MKEIKFKVWDKIDKKMYHVARLWFEQGVLQNVWIETSTGMVKRRALDEVEILQYTGEDDITGKGIYEGDFIRAECYQIPYPITGVIRVFRGSFMIDTAIRSCCLFEAKRIKVIGNIYENPELLEEHEE